MRLTRLLRQSRTVWLSEKQRLPSGILFSPLTKQNETIDPHPLDTEQGEYVEILKEVVFKACSEAVLNTSYKGRILRMLEYSIRPDSHSLSFPLELGYKFFTAKEVLTPGNLTRLRILRGAFEVFLVGFKQLDEIVDKEESKFGKPTWHTICPGGLPTAMYDGLIVSHLPLYIVKRFLNDQPCYPQLLSTLSEGVRDTAAGQTLDILQQLDKTQTSDAYANLTLKTGALVKTQVRLGLILAGVTDEMLLSKLDIVLLELGKAFQIYLDFVDYYCTKEARKAERTDCKTNSLTWVSSTALQHFSDQQKELFWKCYGSDDPSKVDTVVKLYDDIGMPHLYVDKMLAVQEEIKCSISNLNNDPANEMCKSILQWCIGDIEL